MFIFDCHVHKPRSQMASNGTHYLVPDQANIRLGLCFPKSKFPAPTISSHPTTSASPGLIRSPHFHRTLTTVHTVHCQITFHRPENNNNNNYIMTMIMITLGKVFEPQPSIELDHAELYIIVHTTDNDVPTWYNRFLLNTQYINTQLQKVV